VILYTLVMVAILSNGIHEYALREHLTEQRCKDDKAVLEARFPQTIFICDLEA
jgi:hypothetical protein